MTTHPTGTVTFLFSDIEGSTKLAQEVPNAWESLQKRHDTILQRAIEASNGYTFKLIGDAFCAAFPTAGEALQAAVNIQNDLFAEDWGERAVIVRVGIHTGKAEIQENGDYNGYAVLSRVQRLMSAGHGGQTLISQATQDLVCEEIPLGLTLRDMGEHRLKDLIHPEHIYQVDIPNLRKEFPALRTLDMQLNNLPAQFTPFVGREREVAAVLGLMQNHGVRLVTLTGTGGTGKTRLSLQIAADLLDEYEHGVWFVDLSILTDPDLVVKTIASTLKVKEIGRTSIEQSLHDYLREQHLLLILDNFEQVVSAGPVISSLLNAAPKVKVLITSREVLRLRGEHDYPVPPLGLPESKRKQTAAVLGQYEAIALFVQHARAANPAFELDEENAPIVAEICMRLDGLPLAIELAAARSRLLKPVMMLEKLKSRLEVLTGGARDLPHRQQTIRGAIDWSFDLLEEAEKTLFARLGVFVGGWMIESAEAVCGSGLPIDVLRGIESLFDKSLLRQYEGVSGKVRFTMLETIREYAFEKLSQSGELDSIHQAHADIVVALLEKVRVSTSTSEEETQFNQLDDDLDNLRSAVEWTLAQGQPALVFATSRLYQYWYQRTNFREPLAWVECALTISPTTKSIDRAHALNGAGNLVGIIGDSQQAKRYYETALVIYRELNDHYGISACLNNLGNSAWKEKDNEKARQLYEESLAFDEPETFSMSMTLNNLGSLAKIRGDWEQSKKYYLRSREICERLGAEAGISYATFFLGNLAMAQRDLVEAQKLLEDAFKAVWTHSSPLAYKLFNGILGYVHLLIGNEKKARLLLNKSLDAAGEYLSQISTLPDFWFVIEGKARLELLDGQLERAAHLFGAAWTQRENDDSLLTEFERPDYEARLAEARSILGDAAFDETFAKGRAMTLEQVIEYALATTSP